jgi:hypothetical protein
MELHPLASKPLTKSGVKIDNHALSPDLAFGGARTKNCESRKSTEHQRDTRNLSIFSHWIGLPESPSRHTTIYIW